MQSERRNNNPLSFVDPTGLEDYEVTPSSIQVYKDNEKIKIAEGIAENLKSFVPRYGNFGGPGWIGGETGEEDPIDSMDEIFKQHDSDYAAADTYLKETGDKTGHEEMIKKADMTMLDSLVSLPYDPNDWDKPASDSGNANNYRGAAISAFEIKSGYDPYNPNNEYKSEPVGSDGDMNSDTSEIKK